MKGFRVLLFARSSSAYTVQSYLDQLRKLHHGYDKFQVDLYIKHPVRLKGDVQVNQFHSLRDLWRHVENPKDKFDLVIVDDMTESNLAFLLSMMLYRIPVFVEQRFVQLHATYFIAERTVVPFTREKIHSLAFQLISNLRNFNIQMAIMENAYRLAQRNKQLIRKGIDWDDDAEDGTSGSLLGELFRWKGKRKSAQARLSELGREEDDLRHGDDLTEELWEDQGRDVGDNANQNVNNVELEEPYDSRSHLVENTDLAMHGEKLTGSADLVVISYNTLNYLKDCLQSIRKHTHYPHRIIVVDNGSTDGSVEFLRQEHGITLIENTENLGYAKACNQGIGVGHGDFVVILNTDIQVTPHWLTGMVQLAQSDRQIGVVGPKMVNRNDQIMGAGVTQLDGYCTGRGWLVEDGPAVYAEQEDCFSVGGACYLIRREALHRVGGFDENYFFYFEESDLSIRMVEKGYRVVYAPQVRIIHHHEGSLEPRDRMGRQKRNQYFRSSQVQFMHKWKAVLKGAPTREQTKNILVFGVIPWEFRYQRPQQIYSRLAAQGYRILYINNTCQNGGALQEVGPNVYSFSPDGWGIVYRLFSSQKQTQKIIQSIYDVMEKLEFAAPTIWVDAPYWQQILPRFDRVGLVYNCMDSYGEFSDLKEYCPGLEEMEENLATYADLILASSRVLYEKMNDYNQYTYLLPNGVDREHFSLERDLVTPEELRQIPGPIIGYYGAIADWFDLELMDLVTSQLPQVSFVLIGQSTIDTQILGQKPNVYLLGEKSYQELPNYVQHFQVGLIPFKKNKLTDSTNPVKLYEYLATGMPVVSVDLPEVRQFRDVVYIGKDYDEFTDYLREALKGDRWWAKRKRKRAVREEDWDQRVADIVKLLHLQEEQRVQASRIPILRQEWEQRGE